MIKVSIIIPTYNRAHLIGETLDSVIIQSYPNWECIIVDDGSTDNTKEVVNGYLNKDVRFKYFVRPENKVKGANSCRNYGFEKATGSYIKWFDSDDVMAPDFLEKQVDVLDKNSELDFCASFSETFSGSLDNIVAYNNPVITNYDSNSIENFIKGKIIFLTPSPLWRVDFLVGKELFDERLSNSHETDFNFRRLIEGARFQYLKNTHFYVRRGHESIDSLSRYNFTDYISYMLYTDKIVNYLNKRIIEGDESAIELLNYIIKKQQQIIYITRQNFSFFKTSFLSLNVFNNLIKIDCNFRNKIKLIITLLFILIFKKGYKLIYNEK